MADRSEKEAPTITETDLRRDLRALGLEAGDEVVVHSSLSAIGWTEGGPRTVVDALLAVVDETGTILAPTFTASHAKSHPFDPEKTPSQTGAVTEALRTHPDAHRSTHPTHSVAALGAAAEELTAEHPLDASLGPDSPLDRLARRGGRVLLLGVGHESNSTLHVAEKRAGLPWKDRVNEVLVRERGPENKPVRTVETAKVGCGKGFVSFEPVAEQTGILVRGQVGAADAQLVDGADVLSLALELLEHDPGFLLCEDPDCWWCPDARRRLADGTN